LKNNPIISGIFPYLSPAPLSSPVEGERKNDGFLQAGCTRLQKTTKKSSPFPRALRGGKEIGGKRLCILPNLILDLQQQLWHLRYF